jgi:hypothetical protein
MKPEKQQLMHDLLENAKRREATLLAGSRILRERRRWRAARRGLSLALVLAVAGIWIERTNSHKPSGQAPSQAAAPTAPAQAQSLTDDELLALFPDTPVGLATLADGKKRLIFPHSGDEQRFITRL